MNRLRIPIVGQQSANRSVNVNSQLSINLYPQIETDGAKSELTLHSTPGLKLAGSIGNGPGRTNGIRWKNKAYFVSGAQLISIDTSGTITSHGTINTATSNVSMSANPSHIGFVDGTDGWTFDGTSLTQILDGDFPTATQMTFLDGYSIANKSGTGQFQISSLNDTTAWDPTEIATAESNPDDLTALTSTHKELWLFGDQTAEIWYNSENADFPFEPYRNGVSEWGVHAPFSLAKADESLFWLSSNREGVNMVLSARGVSPVAISNRDIEWEIAQLSKTDDAVGWTYQQAGHTFYVLTFPTGDRTIVYDVSTGMWHRRKSFGIGRWRPVGAVALGQKHYSLDYENGNVYELDLNTYDDNGIPIEAIRRTQMIHKDRHRIRVHRLELDIETGVGTLSGQGEDPQIMMRYSKDGGHSYSSEKWRSLGKTGKYATRVYWTQLGIARDWNFEFKITDPVKRNIIGGYADVSVCRP